MKVHFSAAVSNNELSVSIIFFITVTQTVISLFFSQLSHIFVNECWVVVWKRSNRLQMTQINQRCFSLLWRLYKHVTFFCPHLLLHLHADKYYVTLTQCVFEVQHEHLFFAVPMDSLFLCSMCVCVCVWFTAVYIANSGWALFNKPHLGDSGISKAYKLWMKAQAKLIKFNRIKMWLVTQHDFKIALLNDRKQSVFTSSWP